MLNNPKITVNQLFISLEEPAISLFPIYEIIEQSIFKISWVSLITFVLTNKKAFPSGVWTEKWKVLIELDSADSLAAIALSRKRDLSKRANVHSFTHLVFIEHINFGSFNLLGHALTVKQNGCINGFWQDDMVFFTKCLQDKLMEEI